jgi:predicted transcriptional regulator
METATDTTDIRGWRERLGASRLRVAVRADVSTTRLAEFEAGSRPAHSPAFDRVLAALIEIEREKD